jgi:ribosomal protein S27E
MSDRRKKSETNPEPGLVTCPHCGRSTPEENLRCIYCGELLDRPVGPMSELVFGLKGRDSPAQAGASDALRRPMRRPGVHIFHNIPQA